MFTGIVEETGIIQSITSHKISIECNVVTEDVKIGDSIAVNGVCLTVNNFSPTNFSADISPETIQVTSLGKLQAGNIVNLERAMKANGRFGGHIVQGHIDNTGEVLSIKKLQSFYELNIKLKPEQAKYAVKKASIAVDGISLTIAEVNNDIITMAIIPHTFENTNLKILKTGSLVNIEVDITAKYVEKFLSSSNNKSDISLKFLQENGF